MGMQIYMFILNDNWVLKDSFYIFMVDFACLARSIALNTFGINVANETLTNRINWPWPIRKFIQNQNLLDKGNIMRNPTLSNLQLVSQEET